ncbi:MAG: type II secretion system F family protein [Candidatus Omnitrophica bacterium]|nr:type II secretion system F family protein [Candidatus Omnitrophota bacterium]
MPEYRYRARDTMGRLKRGTLEAASEQDAAGILFRMECAPVKISRVSAAEALLRHQAARRSVTEEEVTLFTVQLASMISAGLSILSSLRVLEQQQTNQGFKNILSGMLEGIEAGESFSQSLARYPRVFSHLFISMVKAGEVSGKLPGVLMQYAAFSESQAELRNKVRGALTYPLILIAASVVILTFIVTFVIPRFMAVFSQIGVRLPLATLLLYRTGVIFRSYWYLFIAGFVFLVMFLKRAVRTAGGRYWFDSLCLRVFIIGSLIRKLCIVRFARTFATMLNSGVPLLQSLELVRGMAGNEVIGRAVESMRQAAEKGERLSESMKKSGAFPEDIVQMTAVGETSGDLGQSLQDISALYERTINYRIKKITTLLEPVLLLFMGVFVSFIMVSMIMPLFDMVRILRR